MAAVAAAGYLGLRAWARHQVDLLVEAATRDAREIGNPLISAIRAYHHDTGEWPDPYELERDLTPKYISSVDVRFFVVIDNVPELSARYIFFGDDCRLVGRLDQERWRLGKIELDCPIPP
ncbi:MAG TPA: hypothetical protein PLQ87_12080 [Phycisphaerae bacterium]|nr:hypothetical protein [Phycisphaerae bacterium]